MSDEDAIMLFSVNDRRIWQIAASADEKREKVTGPVVTFVRNQNINVTNYCINSCGFCGFSKKEGEAGGYLSSRDEIRNKAALARQRNVTEICTVSGLHPDFDASPPSGRVLPGFISMPATRWRLPTPQEKAVSPLLRSSNR